MSKIKSMYPVGSFYLRIGNNGQGVVQIRYHINGRYAKKSTGVEVDPKMRDSKYQKVKSSSNPRINSISTQKNIILQELKNNIDKQIISYEGLLTFEVVSQMLNGTFNTKQKQIKETDFIQYCQHLYRNKYEQGKISYSYWYNKYIVIVLKSSLP